MSYFRFLQSTLAVACATLGVVSCSKSTDVYNPTESQSQIYSKAFIQEFGQPATDQNWGFGSFSMVSATEPSGSPVYEEGNPGARRRVVASSVDVVSPVKYNSKESLFENEADTAYFYLRIDGKIVLQEMNGVQGNNMNDYYPKPIDLGNGVRDNQFNTDNQGSINVAEWRKLGLIENNGITYATKDQPIPETVFKNMPTFEAIANHVPDADKIRLAGSVEAFNSTNYKIFWYVVKWQNSDKVIHVDGVLVPTNQITVNIPEYKKRIIVEDLRGNINASTTTIDGSDFDFNDVVFDAITWNRDGKNHLKIIVRAAGGRLPIYVAGKEIHEGIGYMFNTSEPDYNYSKVIVEDSIIGTAADSFDFNSIPVEIESAGIRTAAGSNIGEAPEKIAVDLDYKWCKERQNIKSVYPRFVEYVGNKSVQKWW